MSGTVPSTSHGSPHVTLTISLGKKCPLLPVNKCPLQKRKLSLREIKSFTQSQALMSQQRHCPGLKPVLRATSVTRCPWWAPGCGSRVKGRLQRRGEQSGPGVRPAPARPADHCLALRTLGGPGETGKGRACVAGPRVGGRGVAAESTSPPVCFARPHVPVRQRRPGHAGDPAGESRALCNVSGRGHGVQGASV